MNMEKISKDAISFKCFWVDPIFESLIVDHPLFWGSGKTLVAGLSFATFGEAGGWTHGFVGILVFHFL